MNGVLVLPSRISLANGHMCLASHLLVDNWNSSRSMHKAYGRREWDQGEAIRGDFLEEAVLECEDSAGPEGIE